jgi:hypothetical protein
LLPVLLKTVESTGPVLLKSLVNCPQEKPIETGLSQSNDEKLFLLLGIPLQRDSHGLLLDSFSQLLKACVSISNDCEEAVDRILSVTSLDWLTTFLFLSLRWKNETTCVKDVKIVQVEKEIFLFANSSPLS